MKAVYFLFEFLFNKSCAGLALVLALSIMVTSAQAAEPTAVADDPVILGLPVAPGAVERRDWIAGQSMAGIAVPTPVLITRGQQPGPTLCLTAAVHGDELNGVEVIRRIMFALDPAELSGMLIGVPIVNLHGFQRASRYLPDRRDLNRYFPGDPTGSSAARIAHAFFTQIVLHCDFLIDMHTGSFHRTNLPQLRADLTDPPTLALAKRFGDMAVLDNLGSEGTLRRAAVQAGIAAVTIEAGEPLRLQPDAVDAGVQGIRSVMSSLSMLEAPYRLFKPQPVFYESIWLRADQGGIFLNEMRLGDRVTKGDSLGTVTDPITNRRSELLSPVDGQILGMALNQMVMPGFAAFHLGVVLDEGTVEIERTADAVAEQVLDEVVEPARQAARQAAREAARQSSDPVAVREAAAEAAQQVIDAPATADPQSQPFEDGLPNVPALPDSAPESPQLSPDERDEHPG